jgi:hypothetical protein
MLSPKQSNTIKHINRSYINFNRVTELNIYGFAQLLYIVPEGKKFEGYYSLYNAPSGTLKVNGIAIVRTQTGTDTGLLNPQAKIFLDSGDVVSFSSASTAAAIVYLTGVEF